MSEDQTKNKTKDEILKKLKDIENKIDNQKKESFASGEDQLFFGVIISLLILFVTLPINDMASFLQSVFSVSQEIASTNAGYLKYLGIALFLVSSLTRYCAVISNQSLSKKLRFVSFEALWLGLNIIILTVTINLVTTLSLQIGLLGLSVTFLVLTLIFVGMLLLERYILKVYAKKELVLKGYFPFASVLLLSIIFGICVALIAEVIALASGFVFSTTRFLLVYAITTVIVILITLPKWRFEKKEATRKRENTEESTVSEVRIKKAWTRKRLNFVLREIVLGKDCRMNESEKMKLFRLVGDYTFQDSAEVKSEHLFRTKSFKDLTSIIKSKKLEREFSRAKWANGESKRKLFRKLAKYLGSDGTSPRRFSVCSFIP